VWNKRRTIYLDRPVQREHIIHAVVMIPHLVTPNRPRDPIALKHDRAARIIVRALATSRGIGVAEVANRDLAVPFFVVYRHPHPQRRRPRYEWRRVGTDAVQPDPVSSRMVSRYLPRDRDLLSEVESQRAVCAARYDVHLIPIRRVRREVIRYPSAPPHSILVSTSGGRKGDVRDNQLLA
jgi:hypothetical protein